MHRPTILARLGIAVLIAPLAGIGCSPTEQASEESAEESVEETTAKSSASSAQSQRFEDLEPGETATFQNGLELTLTDAGIVTTPDTPPAVDKSGRPKPSDPNRVLQNITPPGTELLALRFNATMDGPEGVMPARIESALACHDSNGNVLPGFAAHNQLRDAIRSAAGLPELPRQSAPAQQFSGSPLENGQSRDALLVCEKPLIGGEVDAGVNLRAQGTPGQEPPGAWWTVDPEDLDTFPPDRI